MFFKSKSKMYSNLNRVAKPGDMVEVPTGNVYRIGDRGVRLVYGGRTLSVGLMIYPTSECKFVSSDE